MPTAPFDDVRLDHPWVEKYRLPVLKTAYPHNSYFVTVVVPDEADEADEYFFLTSPNEEDAELAASYLQYRISKFNYYPRFLEQMAQKPVDVDTSINTVSLEKRKNGTWAYKMLTWTMHGSKPFINDPDPCTSLLALLDYIERDYEGGVHAKWQEWKDTHKLG